MNEDEMLAMRINWSDANDRSLLFKGAPVAAGRAADRVVGTVEDIRGSRLRVRTGAGKKGFKTIQVGKGVSVYLVLAAIPW